MLTFLISVMILGLDDQQNNRLIETLRDAQTTNRELTKSGRATMRVEYNIVKPARNIDAIVEVETTWLDQEALEKRRFYSKTSDLFGRVNETPIDKSGRVLAL